MSGFLVSPSHALSMRARAHALSGRRCRPDFEFGCGSKVRCVDGFSGQMIVEIFRNPAGSCGRDHASRKPLFLKCGSVPDGLSEMAGKLQLVAAHEQTVVSFVVLGTHVPHSNASEVVEVIYLVGHLSVLASARREPRTVRPFDCGVVLECRHVFLHSFAIALRRWVRAAGRP